MPFKKKEKKYLLNVYKRYPVCMVRGRGMYLWDNKGKRYLDFLSGIAVNAFGHCNKLITKAVEKQINSLVHVSNLFYTKPQIELGKKINSLYGKGKVFFSNSGAEANECAIKFARKWGQQQKKDKYEIITFAQSFHGRTFATLSATGQKKMHQGFAPLLPGFKYAVFNDINSVKKKFSKKICAVIIEPIQGEGGVHIADKKFIKELALLCKKNNALLIFDEIQVGMGRTGTLFAYQQYGVKPDIVTLAKSLAAGFPLGATIVKAAISDTFSYGSHGSTFGGNVVACASAIEVFKLLNKKRLSYIKTMGEYLALKLNDLKQKYPFIKNVRGKGLIFAIELDFPAQEIVAKCLKKGVCINAVQEKVLRFLPPYIVKKQDIDTVIKILDNILKG